MSQDWPTRVYTIADHDWVVDQHQALYRASDGFDDSFGPHVAKVLHNFEASHDPTKERGWILVPDGAPEGSIFCMDGGQSMAQLRLFFTLPGQRGIGAGRYLCGLCLDFAKATGFRGLFLWTHKQHLAACRLYQSMGLQPTDEIPVHNFGQDLIEQRWQIDF